MFIFDYVIKWAKLIHANIVNIDFHTLRLQSFNTDNRYCKMPIFSIIYLSLAAIPFKAIWSQSFLKCLVQLFLDYFFLGELKQNKLNLFIKVINLMILILKPIKILTKSKLVTKNDWEIHQCARIEALSSIQNFSLERTSPLYLLYMVETSFPRQKTDFLKLVFAYSVRNVAKCILNDTSSLL